MKNSPCTSVGPSKIDGHWNDLSTLERVKVILKNVDHFLFNDLVTRNELREVMSMSESEWEYIIDREDQPLFTRINVKKEISTQYMRDQLKTALSAVFL